MTHVVLAFAAFAASACAAIPWALYTKYISEKKAHRAGLADAAIYLIASVGTTALIESRWYVLPTALGAYVGTRIALRRKDAHS